MDRAEAWKQINAQFLKYERRFKADMRRYFREQEDRVLQRDTKDVIRFDKAAENDLLLNVVTGLYSTIIAEQGQMALGSISTSQLFLVDRSNISLFLRELTGKITEANATTERAIRDTLNAGVESGEGINRLQDRVGLVYDQAAGFRAETIARTEVIKSSNFARHEGFAQSGVVSEEQWLSVPDGRIRDAHLSADGQKKPINGKFRVGSDLLSYPGDPSGSPGNIINCRCSALPVV